MTSPHVDRDGRHSSVLELDHLVWPMTASEQMYYAGAPLAHVVRYEHELRMNRDRRMLHRRAIPLPSSRFEAGALFGSREPALDALGPSRQAEQFAQLA
jgi:hypothetical protein